MKDLKKKVMLVVMACGFGVGVSSSFANEHIPPPNAHLCYECEKTADGYQCQWTACQSNS